MPRLYTRNPTGLYTRESNSVVHADADVYDGADGDDDDDDGDDVDADVYDGADSDDDDDGDGDGDGDDIDIDIDDDDDGDYHDAAGDDDGDDDGYNEVKQRVRLVDPTLFFPSPTPPPKVEV